MANSTLHLIGKKITLAAAMLTLAGCGVTLPKSILHEKIDPLTEMTKHQSYDTWSASPALIKETINAPAIISVPGLLPDKIASKHIIASTTEKHTVRDLLNALGEYGVPSLLSSDEIAAKTVPITGYSGTVGNLLDAVSSALEISFTWNGSLLSVGPKGRFTYSMVQDPAIMEKVKGEIETMGAEKISLSPVTGLISFDAPYRSQENITTYMDKVIHGMGTVNLQVSVLTTSLNQNVNDGFDWTSIVSTIRGGVALVEDAADTATDTTEAVAAAASVVRDGLKATLDGGDLNIAFDSDDFSLSGLINVLNKYGETRTSQNVVLKTLPSTEVVIRSGSSIPYVSGVSVGTTTSTGTTTNGSILGGVQTSTVDTGITAKITPNLDSKSNIVTLNVGLEVKSLIQFVDLSAGNQVGALTQPSVQEQSFNDIARMRLGDTVVLGGIVYETSSDDRNTLKGLEDKSLGNSKREIKKEAMFIVIRPTAKLYEFEPVKKGGK